MSITLVIAAVLAMATFFIHTFAGGRVVASPLLAAADLRRVPKLTMYFCWHIVTLVLLLLAASLGYAAAVEPHNRALVMLCLLLAAGCALWNLALIIATRSSPWHLPQWTLFTAIAAPIAWHLVLG